MINQLTLKYMKLGAKTVFYSTLLLGWCIVIPYSVFIFEINQQCTLERKTLNKFLKKECDCESLKCFDTYAKCLEYKNEQSLNNKIRE